MKALISLSVKYGFPIQALYGFLNSRDHEIWNSYLQYLTHEVSVSESEGKIYWLIRGYDNIAELKRELSDLPLLKEEFLELQVHELADFRDLSCLFESRPRQLV